jgi:Tol biopolymer transport system component
MTVSAPPRPPSPARTAPDSKPLEREEIEALVEALIEEARREQRRRHRRYWALAALAALVGAVILILLDGGAASQTPSPARSARSGAASVGTPSSKIAFASTVGCIPLRHCWWGLFVMNLDGSGKRRLAPHFWISNFGESPLAWSPDRRKLLFSAHLSRSAAPCASYCGKEIFVINADGSGLRRLTRNTVADWDPDWSPDGQEVAWIRSDGTGTDIFVMNADGSDQQNLTPMPGNRGEPRWSPDGQAILFTAVPPGQSRSASGWPHRDDVYVMNADGSGQRKLTHTREAGEFGPAWSPDGQQIAFTQHAGTSGEVRIFVMNADGSAKHAVTPKLAHTGDGWITVTAAWSPDGRRIAFDYHYAIYVVNADGSELRRLAQNAYAFHSWSPDGRKLIFARLPGLWVMNADGSGQRNLTRDG